MADVYIDYQVLNQIAGSLKNLAVDLAAKTTWEDELADAVKEVWWGLTAEAAHDAVTTMIEDWDYVRAVLAVQAQNAALRADAIGAAFNDWDFGVGTPGVTELEKGSFEANEVGA